ncbi:type II toxin-antitoxin system RelE/ParE family toxin [Streptosporangium sp. NBC_01639]|uniref:type II toxin-antitoxin system RelE/ParE family toxin n=1 Tax=unclassified Streptosporangium TaxID=2632669 RepID=UPI002DDB58E8|nr:type II toxin-antitoxin system RelE/ParE family toxin [Streptosporangium sp. NBC_01756]WSC89074.1 type II toxin-antitoxin system RelE/ParE family toxin [Streptosporangium sp. NBC_01756]WTD52247.1 type II toxin-antitoxin system RelE/ParE family toxin [Streptosporangium sp. NBC_01639]
MRLYVIEIEPEIQSWLEALSERDYVKVEALADLLAEQAETLNEPYSRHLGGKLRELRLALTHRDVRITYWLAPERRVVLLTFFFKTRRKETGQIERARRAQVECETRHTATSQIYDRIWKD